MLWLAQLHLVPYSRIIEVEPSVNITNGQSAVIVQVKDNRIVGLLEDVAESSSTPSTSQSQSPARSSPHTSQELRLSPLRTSPARDRGTLGNQRSGEKFDDPLSHDCDIDATDTHCKHS